MGTVTYNRMNMKRLLVVLLLGVPLLSGCGQESPLRKISVSGTAVKEMTADQLEMRLSIRNYSSENASAVAENAKSTALALDLLKKSGHAIKDLQKFGTEFGRREEYSGQKFDKSESYYAETEIAFKVVDLDKHDSISQELAAIPGLNIRGARYSLADEISRRAKVRHEAIEKAKEKASEMAKALGMRIGYPISISEESPAFPIALGINSADAAAPQPEAVGSITIESSVSIEFELLAD